ncbi:MAG: hypothetical protein Kow0069_06800 [Promethearchaeota archaeon]
MASVAFGVLLGVAAYAALHVGKGVQKYAIEGFRGASGAVSGKGRNSGIWLVGLGMTTSFMFVSWAALLFAPVNLVAPLEGVGLICLLFFSWRVLGEPINPPERLGVVLVVLGTAVVAAAAPPARQLFLADFDAGGFWQAAALTLVPEFSLYFVGLARKWRSRGVVMAFVAGTTMAFQTLAKRITSIPAVLVPYT